ncbi:hypothetical protein U1Q18_031756, partial [Sarracenia purpurea var. burkii]
ALSKRQELFVKRLDIYGHALTAMTRNGSESQLAGILDITNLGEETDKSSGRIVNSEDFDGIYKTLRDNNVSKAIEMG